MSVKCRDSFLNFKVKTTFPLNTYCFIGLYTIEYCVLLHVSGHYWPFALILNKKHLKNVGPIRHNEPPHANSPDVASGTVARRLRIDVDDNANANDDNDDNDNA